MAAGYQMIFNEPIEQFDIVAQWDVLIASLGKNCTFGARWHF